MNRIVAVARRHLRRLTTTWPVLTLHLAMGVAFLSMALSCLVAMGAWGRAVWFLAWPASSLVLVALGYLGAGAAVLGKRSDGTFRWHLALLHMPYLAAAEAAWYAVRVLGSDEPWQEVSRGLFLGRRVQHWELPARVGFVLDMTAEFVEPVEVRTNRRYLCVPTLDGSPPDVRRLAESIASVLPFAGNIYVHCAAGYGRSATAMAVLLVARGVARDVDEAIALMQSVRPRVRLRTSQRRTVDRVLSALRHMGVAESPSPSAGCLAKPARRPEPSDESR